MDKIELIATINIRHIPVYSEYMEIPTEKGLIKVKMVVRVKSDHIETAQKRLNELFNNIKDDQIYKENMGDYINMGKTIIKIAIITINYESYDVLISG